MTSGINVPLRKSPSGPKAVLPAPAPVPPSGEFPFFHIENVTFSTYTFENPAPSDPLTDESQSTKELTVQIGPLPPLTSPNDVYDVIVNPSPETEGRPLWMDSFSISHVRIQDFVFVPGPDGGNPWIPPEGAYVANVVLGVSLLKEVPVDGQLTAGLEVDLMFFLRGIELNVRAAPA